MTVFEFFRDRYLESIADPRPPIRVNESVDRNSFKFVDTWLKEVSGASWLQTLKKAGFTTAELESLRKDGVLAHQEYSNWMARQTGRTHLWWLTAKGRKALYKAYAKWPTGDK
jgi:hypothetical protein